jgi:cell division protein FtsI/penicillin-binding protein 2
MRYVRKNNLKKRAAKNNWRVAVLKFFIIVLVTATVVKLFNLQVRGRELYSIMASTQHEIYQKLFPKRGRIFARDKDNNGEDKFFPLTINKEYGLIFAQPNLISDPDGAARQIYHLLFKEEIENTKTRKHEDNETQEHENNDVEGVEEEKEGDSDDYLDSEIFENLLSKLNKEDDPYEPLKHKVDLETVEEIKKLGIKGINSRKELWRYYPDSSIESHFLGFVRNEDEKSVGQYGIEGYFNDTLSGTYGYLFGEEGAKGGQIVLGNMDFVEAQDGSDIYLTIDRNIQFKAYEYLRGAVQDYEIEEGTILVMNPKTGAILAMVNYPDFDPNNYSQVESISMFNNQAILHTYEPGSIFKAITMAAALDLDKVNPDTKYYDEGFVKVDRFTIRNVDGKANEWQTMTQVLEKSLNTGAIFAANEVGNRDFLDYVKKFGFGERTGIELAGETLGDISSLEILNDVYTFTASFGQGITVTPIQMITAFGAIANDGKLMKPYLVDEIIDHEGKSTKILPQQIRQVISPRAAILLKAMLVSVINSGHSKMAGVKGYHLAGKTGTAQVSDEGGGYSEDRFNHSFVGFGPVDDPEFVILIKLNNPQGARFASESTAPIFRKLSEFILKYYEIPPTRQ